MTATISPLAAVDSRATIGDGVFIGPFCNVGPQVTIGEGTRLDSNVVVAGRVTIGSENRIHAGAVIGGEPQDLSYHGADTSVLIGNRNTIRECVTINRGTEKEDGQTEIGDDCFFMACSHIAHDCKISNRVVIANGTLLGGHVHVHDDATLSGGCGVHHFATIGSYAFVSGLSRVLHDIPPYMLADGSPARPRCINVVALRRNSFPPDVIETLAHAHKLLFRNKVGVDAAREQLREQGLMLPAVNQLLTFIQLQHEGRHGRSRERRRAA